MTGRRQKILFCTHHIERGGSPRSLAILVSRLARRHDIAIVSLREPAEDSPVLAWYQKLGVPVFSFPWGWLPVNYVNCPINKEVHKARSLRMRPYTPQLRWIGEAADHICFNGYPATSLAPLLPRATPKTLIAREVLDEGDPALARTARYLRANIARAVAIGPVESDQLAAFGIAHVTIPNSAPKTPAPLPLPQGEAVRFGVFARMDPGKGLDTLARAVALAAPALRRHGSTVRLYGTDPAAPAPLERDLRAFAAREGIGDLLRFEPWVEDTETAMAGLHCLVRPDASGSPWGRDIIESMSLGRPVLATGTREIFVRDGENGWLVPPREPAPLAEKLALLAADVPLLAAAGAAAGRYAAEHFDPEFNAARVERYLFGDGAEAEETPRA